MKEVGHFRQNFHVQGDLPTSVTVNNLDRRSSPYFALFHRIRVALETDHVTVVEERFSSAA